MFKNVIDVFESRFTAQSTEITELVKLVQDISDWSPNKCLSKSVLEVNDTVDMPTENLFAMDKQNEEAMTQTKITIEKEVPETQQSTKQKRQKPNPSGEELGTGHVITVDLSETLQTNSQAESEALKAMSSLDYVDNSSQVPAQRDIHNSNIVLDNELYVSKFNNQTTVDDIESFISHQNNFDMSNIKAIHLTKKDQDVSLLSSISFKIETNNTIAQHLLEPGFWPLNCEAKRFIRKSQSNLARATTSSNPIANPPDFLYQIRNHPPPT